MPLTMAIGNQRRRRSRRSRVYYRTQATSSTISVKMSIISKYNFMSHFTELGRGYRSSNRRIVVREGNFRRQNKRPIVGRSTRRNKCCSYNLTRTHRRSTQPDQLFNAVSVKIGHGGVLWGMGRGKRRLMQPSIPTMKKDARVSDWAFQEECALRQSLRHKARRMNLASGTGFTLGLLRV